MTSSKLPIGSLLALLTISCSNSTYWTRQESDALNSSYRYVEPGSPPFTFTGIGPYLPVQAVEGTTLDATNRDLYAATRLRAVERRDLKSGALLCRIETTAELTAAPLVAGGNAAFAGGYYGNVWKFDVSPRSCRIEQGWPVQLHGTVTGPLLQHGTSILAATVEGEVASIDTWESDGPSIEWQTNVNAEIVGSPAMVTIPDPVRISQTLVLLSTESAGIKIVDADNGQEVPSPLHAGILKAGPVVGIARDLSPIVVVAGYDSKVSGIALKRPFHILWTADLSDISQSPVRFEVEPTIAGTSVYLTNGTHLIGLNLEDGSRKWPPIDLQNSGGALRPASTSRGEIFVADGYVLKVFDGNTGALEGVTTPISTQGILNVRPTITEDGTVITGDAESILRFR